MTIMEDELERLDEPETLPQEIVEWQPRTGPLLNTPKPTLTLGAVLGAAAGALAVGAVAVGAVAIARLAIGGLAVNKARIRELEIDRLVVRDLKILNQ